MKDGNNNFLFDLPSEEIAFLDSSLIVNANFARLLLGDSVVAAAQPDTISMDSTAVASDSLAVPGPDLNSIYIDLMLFTEASQIQYLTDYKREDRRKIEIVFALPLTDTFAYHTLQAENESGPRFLEKYSPFRDSLTLWLMDSTDYKKDTIQMALDYTVMDTTEQFILRSDTIMFTYREKVSKNRREEKVEETLEKLEIHTIRNNSNHDLNRELSMLLDFPVGRVNDTLFFLYQIPDSVELPVPFIIKADTLSPYRVTLSSNWESDSKYRLEALPGAITSIYPMQHDTIDVSFKTRDTEFYGQILLTLKGINNQVLVQLFNGKSMVEERIVNSDGQYAFPYLAPKEYQFKFIHDTNENGKWDTGNYLEKLQPESVELLPVIIEVRSNWDHDVAVTLEK